MSVPSQQSTFSLSPQNAKITDDGTFAVGSHTWHRFLINRIGGLSQQMQTVLPPENGSVIVPKGSYKFGAFVQSQLAFIPRLEGNIGWLLQACMGDATSVADANYTASGFVETNHVGVNAHVFRFDPSDSSFQPWIAVRRTVPGDTVMGEVGYDSKVTDLTFTVPGAGLIQATAGILGRQFFQEDPSGWSYAAPFEGSDSVPMSGRGFVKIGGTRYPITALQVSINNGVTTPQQEMVVGSFHPDDMVALSRQVQLRIVYKWHNPELYRRVLNGGPSALDWDTMPFVTQTAGVTPAFEAEFGSAGEIGAADDQAYKLKFFANKVSWLLDQGGVELAAGDILQVPFVGTVEDVGDGSDYFVIAVENGVSNYTWPS